MSAVDDILGQLPGLTLPPNLLGAMIHQESGGNPNAVSPRGARDLLQTMSTTETNPGFGVRPLDPTKDPHQERLRIGTDYMGAMLHRYGGNVTNALAAYNWGPGHTDNWLAKGADPAQLPAETRSYISNITRNAGIRDAGTQFQGSKPQTLDEILSELPTLMGRRPAATPQQVNWVNSGTPGIVESL